MDDERVRKRDHLQNWLRKHSEFLNWVLVCVGGMTLVLVIIQTYYGWVAIGDRAEQQRPRLSLRIELEHIDDPAGHRIVMPLEIGGTTTARRVIAKNYVTSAQPRQRDYLSSVDLHWASRDGHKIGDVLPTEVGRRIVADPLSRQQIKTILSTEESLYFIGRLEYCDIEDDCYYFMRCAEVGDTGFAQALVYCGTRSGRLEEPEGEEGTGIAPVSRDHPAYVYMRDGDGTVCELVDAHESQLIGEGKSKTRNLSRPAPWPVPLQRGGTGRARVHTGAFVLWRT